jgi:hypothetical protein
VDRTQPASSARVHRPQAHTHGEGTNGSNDAEIQCHLWLKMTFKGGHLFAPQPTALLRASLSELTEGSDPRPPLELGELHRP